MFTSTNLIPNPTYEENEYGEMDVKQSDDTRTRMPTDAIYRENEYGEIHRAETDPNFDRKSGDTTSESASNALESEPNHFGEDTLQKAKEYHSDEVYPENRFGELGRADTFVAGQAHLSDKIKGMS